MEQTEGNNSGYETRCNRRERVDSDDSQSDCKRVRVDSDEPDRPINKMDESESDDIVREEFLEILEDEIEIGSDIQGLDSVIRSLEEEINRPIYDCDQLHIGYLLEASDCELGLPPTSSSDDVSGVEIDSSTANLAGGDSHAGDLLEIDGLFDCGGCDASELPELQWFPESMPAL